MATTTNYGWTTPDDTALVKDGAAAIRTLGSSVDTTTKALNPSTTLGDLEYRSATANTNTRLGIGSTGDVLTVAGGVPTWAAASAGGSYTLLNAGGTALTGATVITVSFTAHSQIFAFIEDGTTGAANTTFNWRVNADTTAANYYSAGLKYTGGAAGIENRTGTFDAFGTGNDNASVGDCFINLFNASSTVTAKPAILSGAAGFSQSQNYSYTGIYKGNAAVTSISIVSNGGNFTGGTIYVYGAN